ncbi:MAG TPA: hypothetical protein PKD68_00795 [Candidatus Saccharibacteria bacterium]|nr:hypothetical protein [Candidatus Saccharibacteria bacterium]
MIQKPVVYAFIDSQNLNLGINAVGWKLDFKKFRLYLKNKYGVEKAHLLVPNARYSKLLGNFQKYIFRLDRLKNTLEYKKDQRQRSVETLGVSGHGDTKSVAKNSKKVNSLRRRSTL